MASNNVMAIPTYDDIFCPPTKHIEPKNIYFKTLLENGFKEKVKLKVMIRNNHSNTKPLNFGVTHHIWKA